MILTIYLSTGSPIDALQYGAYVVVIEMLLCMVVGALPMAQSALTKLNHEPGQPPIQRASSYG